MTDRRSRRRWPSRRAPAGGSASSSSTAAPTRRASPRSSPPSSACRASPWPAARPSPRSSRCSRAARARGCGVVAARRDRAAARARRGRAARPTASSSASRWRAGSSRWCTSPPHARSRPCCAASTRRSTPRSPCAGLAARFPEESARSVLDPAQRRVAVTVVLAALVGLMLEPAVTATVIVGVLAAFTLAATAWRLVLGFASLGRPVARAPAARARRPRPARLHGARPALREGAVLGRAARRARRARLPARPARRAPARRGRRRRDARRARAAEPARRTSRSSMVPPGQPRTKPRALQLRAAARAAASCVVVYDAEDRPEPDQLRQAVGRLRRRRPARRLPAGAARLLQRGDEPADALVRRRLRGAVRPAAARRSTRSGRADPARRHVEPLPHRRAARARRLGPVQRHRGRRPRHPPARRGLRDGDARLDHARGGATPRSATGCASARAGARATCRPCLVHLRHPLRLARRLGVRGVARFAAAARRRRARAARPAAVLAADDASAFLGQADWVRSLSSRRRSSTSPRSRSSGPSGAILLAGRGSARARLFDVVREALFAPLAWALVAVATLARRAAARSRGRTTGRRPSTAPTSEDESMSVAVASPPRGRCPPRAARPRRCRGRWPRAAGARRRRRVPRRRSVGSPSPHVVAGDALATSARARPRLARRPPKLAYHRLRRAAAGPLALVPFALVGGWPRRRCRSPAAARGRGGRAARPHARALRDARRGARAAGRALRAEPAARLPRGRESPARSSSRSSRSRCTGSSAGRAMPTRAALLEAGAASGCSC